MFTAPACFTVKKMRCFYCKNPRIKKCRLEFPLWLIRVRTWLVPMRMWVWSLASLSGLRIQHCHELWCRSQTWLRLWCRPAAIAWIRSQAWELPHASDQALKKDVLDPQNTGLWFPSHKESRPWLYGSLLSYTKIGPMGWLPLATVSPGQNPSHRMSTPKTLKLSSFVHFSRLWESEFPPWVWKWWEMLETLGVDLRQ